MGQLEAMGAFEYLLPFLLVFAIVYSVLSFVKIFQNNKAVNAIISLAVALMALQFNIMSYFFADIFPRLGIGLAIVLVIIIIGGFFFDFDNKSLKWVLFLLMVIMLVIIVWGPLRNIGLFQGVSLNFFGANLTNVIIVAVAIGLVVWMLSSGNKPKLGEPPITTVYKSYK